MLLLIIIINVNNTYEYRVKPKRDNRHKLTDKCFSIKHNNYQNNNNINSNRCLTWIEIHF